MELLQSKNLKLPTVYFITDRTEIKDVPIGIPFIYGDENVRNNMIRLLEYEILYKSAVATGYPFNFKKILKEHGYDGDKNFKNSDKTYLERSTPSTQKSDFDIDKRKPISESYTTFDQYAGDTSAYVDMETLKSLNVFPVWLSSIEDAVNTNIHNFAVYNPDMYNKKLEGMYGGIDLKPPGKNLIIIDISGSIPRAVSTTCLTLAKNLSETFYADLLITGSKSTLYSYDELHKLDVTTIYDENGTDNDQIWFKKLLTSDERHYTTAIVFGDNDRPGNHWNNKFNSGASYMTEEDGKKLCKWKVDKLISFHTDSEGRGQRQKVAGYGRWFTPESTEKIESWVKYLS